VYFDSRDANENLQSVTFGDRSAALRAHSYVEHDPFVSFCGRGACTTRKLISNVQREATTQADHYENSRKIG
jgi:hypothetical protein